MDLHVTLDLASVGAGIIIGMILVPIFHMFFH